MGIIFKGSDIIEDIAGTKNYSGSVTVPVGATFCLVAIMYDDAALISSISLDGESCTLVREISGATPPSSIKGKMYRVSGFGAGSKTFACNWSSSIDYGPVYMFLFFSGVNLDDPIHDHDYGALGAEGWCISNSLDSSTTDMIVGVAGSRVGSADFDYGTQIEVYSNYNSGETVGYGSGYQSGTGSSDTIRAYGSYISLIAVSLNPTVIGGGGAIMY